ncbi:MAG: hypothetical protein ACLTDR_13500 [Adlercreutzia equolifaciens]
MESPAYSSESGVGMEDAEPSGALEGDNAHLVIALKFRDADRFGVVAAGEIQREPEHFEFTERVNVGAVA